MKIQKNIGIVSLVGVLSACGDEGPIYNIVQSGNSAVEYTCEDWVSRLKSCGDEEEWEDLMQTCREFDFEHTEAGLQLFQCYHDAGCNAEQMGYCSDAYCSTNKC